jgi:hypothetical protein
MTENDRAPPECTPGPWKVGPRGQGIERILIQTADVHNGQRVCFICDETGDDPTADANARLIASAPDLLDVAETAARVFRTYELLHASKTPPDENKAARNRQYAEFCEAAVKRARAP